MNTIYLRTGRESLPGLKNIAKLLENQTVTPETTLTKALKNSPSAAYLGDNDLKALGAGRIVRKTSERQSRWVIDAAVSTWQDNASNASNPNDIGLFLGLGTVDCEDDDAPMPFDGSLNDYAVQMLAEAKPLAGLTMLNSTTASHIAQLTDIKGVNSVFSPFADAGAQALIEAWFNLQEQHCEQALVAAGSQKITPWYFLAHRDFIDQWDTDTAFATESAAALVASRNAENADAKLCYAKRGFIHSDDKPLKSMQQIADAMQAQDMAMPNQIIVTGSFGLSELQEQSLLSRNTQAKLCYLDPLIGYTGPAGAVHATHLAIAMLKTQKGLHGKTTEDLASDNVLIVAKGHNGQVCYLVIGGCHA